MAKLIEMKLPAAAALVRDFIEETFSYYAFPSEHHRSLRTNNPLERIMRGIRRRTRVVGAFPDGNSALLLVCPSGRKTRPPMHTPNRKSYHQRRNL